MAKKLHISINIHHQTSETTVLEKLIDGNLLAINPFLNSGIFSSFYWKEDDREPEEDIWQ